MLTRPWQVATLILALLWRVGVPVMRILLLLPEKVLMFMITPKLKCLRKSAPSMDVFMFAWVKSPVAYGCFE